MPQPSSRDRFLTALTAAIKDGHLTKLTLGKYRGPDATLKNLTVRPVALKSGPHLSFVWRHATQDVTKNHAPAQALAALTDLIGDPFRDAHLFTPLQTAQLETADDGHARVRFKVASTAPPPAGAGHNRRKSRLIDPHAGWLRDLGITDPAGQPRTGQSAKFRQIQKFAEILHQLMGDRANAGPPLRIADMGSGKGYLTFATSALLGDHAKVTGIELRQELVDTCNRVATAHDLHHLQFMVGDIAQTASALGDLDVLIALHACDTATDDALLAGIRAGARTLVVAPCCQKELRPQLTAPAVLAPALRHGIFQERHAEFVTDAMRALLLEAVGFETKVFEFVSTEHTAKNLMIIAQRPQADKTPTPTPTAVGKLRAFAQFYGVEQHTLAGHLAINLSADN
jgi:SAM-dependent methyltransferase